MHRNDHGTVSEQQAEQVGNSQSCGVVAVWPSNTFKVHQTQSCLTDDNMMATF